MPTVISTTVTLDTTLSNSRSYFYSSIEKYIEHLNDFAERDCTLVEFTCESKLFGPMTGKIFLKNADPFEYDKDNVTCSVVIMLNCSFTDEDKIYDTLDKDDILCNCINENLKKFVDEINGALQIIRYPTNAVIYFTEDEEYFVRVSPFSDKRVIEFESLGLIETTLIGSDLLENLDVEVEE